MANAWLLNCSPAAAHLSLADAKQLAANGAELVEADAADSEQLRSAFEGAYGVFAVTVAMGGGGLENIYQNELEKGVYGRVWTVHSLT